jgi:hypothetical protein
MIMIYFRTVKKNSEFSKKGGKSLQRKRIMSTRHNTCNKGYIIYRIEEYVYLSIKLKDAHDRQYNYMKITIFTLIGMIRLIGFNIYMRVLTWEKL